MVTKKTRFLVSIILVFAVCSLLTIKAHEPKALLHFVQISDTHLHYPYVKDGTRLHGSSEKLLNDAVNQINKINSLDFVLGTGDLVDVPERPLVKKFIEITKEVKYPFFVTLGNHDVSVGGGLGKRGFIRQFYKQKDATSFTNKKPYYSFSPNDKFLIICLDGTTDALITSHGQIQDGKQFAWLEKELEANKDKYVIIAMHFPLIEPYKSSTHFFLEPDRTKLLDLIHSYKNVIGVFTGHYHAAGLIKIKNKIHNSCPAVIQWPNAFREVIITQDDPDYLNVEFKWHLVNGEKLRNVSKESTSSWRLTQGSEEDREQVMRIRVY